MKEFPEDSLIHQFYYTLFVLRKRRELLSMELDDLSNRAQTSEIREEVSFWEKKNENLVLTETKIQEDLLLFAPWP